MKTAITLGLAFIVVIAGILYGSPLILFFDLPSLCFGISIPILALISKFSIRDIVSLNDDVRKMGVASSLLGGSIGMTTSMVQMLMNLTEPESLGPAMAVCLLSPFYALILCMVFIFGKGSTKPLPLMNALSAVSIFGSMFGFFILAVSFMKI